MSLSIEALLAEKDCLILDGATGTELERRGFRLESPDWSAAAIRQAPELLQAIHADYVLSGANVITANTFRTHPRNLHGTEWQGHSRELTFEAVQIAKAAAGTDVLVAGSIAPLEDCYSPELTPQYDQLLYEHHELILQLVEAGVDVLLGETQLTIRESRVIAQIAASTEVPFFISFVTGRDGMLLSGESLDSAIRAMAEYEPVGCLVNCLPADEVTVVKSRLSGVSSKLLIGAYANTGRMLRNGIWESTSARDPAIYADFAASWKKDGMRVIGGCCGTTPDHVSRLKEFV